MEIDRFCQPMQLNQVTAVTACSHLLREHGDLPFVTSVERACEVDATAKCLEAKLVYLLPCVCVVSLSSRRLNTLNKCASMKLDVNLPKKKVSQTFLLWVWVCVCTMCVFSQLRVPL